MVIDVLLNAKQPRNAYSVLFEILPRPHVVYTGRVLEIVLWAG